MRTREMSSNVLCVPALCKFAWLIINKTVKVEESMEETLRLRVYSSLCLASWEYTLVIV